jgi:CelD/BcsL family acetyltransferase involved in cellulose biosynthesis
MANMGRSHQGPILRTRILQSAAELQSVEPLWRQLAADPGGGTIFQGFGWNRLAATCFAGDEAPLVICCESNSGAAIVPAVARRDGTLGLLGEKLFDYRDVLYAGDETALEHAWQRLARLRRPFSLVALRGEQSRWRWRRAQPRPFAHAPGVRLQDLGPGPEGPMEVRPTGNSNAGPVLAAAHGTTLRTGTASPDPQQCRDNFLGRQPRLRRLVRRLAREGAVLRRHAGSERELLRFIYESKGSQATAGENLFHQAARREFMINIAAEAESRCEVFTYETNSQLLSALVTFRQDAIRYFYTIYYDARWADFSPGQLLLFEASAISLAEGLDCDYMTGESLLKNRLATSRVPLAQVEASAEELPWLFSMRKGPERPALEPAAG